MSWSNESVLSYLREADSTFRNGFETEEMKAIFLDNVFQEIVGCELHLILKKTTSTILENFVAVSSCENLLQIFKVCQENLDEVLSSLGGCHVLKHCLKRMIVLLSKADINTVEWKQLFVIVSSCCTFVKNSNELNIWLTETSQAFQYFIAALGATNAVLTDRKQKSQDQCDSSTNEVTVPKNKIPQIFSETFEQLITCFSSLQKIKIVEFLNHDKAAPCICCMLKVASHRLSPSLEKLCNKLLSACQRKEPDDWSTLIVLVKDRIASHVIDSLLEVNHKETNSKIIEILAAEEHLVDLACHSVANFVIQKLIVKSVSTDQFDHVFGILIKGLEDILATEKYGVVQKLTEQCVTVKHCQKALIDALLKTFHCSDEHQTKFVVSLIASYSTYDLFFNAGGNEVPPLSTISYHGSVLLQTLMKFDGPFCISDSLIFIPIKHVVRIACHASGSHIIDAFFNSSTIDDSVKMKFIMHTRDQYHVLARDKYGNKVLWNMWTRSNLRMKVAIAESLVNYDDLKTHRSGKYVLIHFRLRDFVEKRENWNKFQMQQERKRKSFDEFLNTDTKKFKSKVKKQCK